MKTPKFPKTIYVGFDVADGEPPIMIAHADREGALELCDDGEKIAVYELTFVGRAEVKRDIKPAKAGRK